uniref:Mos1 transposase HTH domain-containing protein n=1 Tax=Glossina palpalis gambiensis TaxID=67801 RepID=A0A1B0AWG9_9MUSC
MQVYLLAIYGIHFNRLTAVQQISIAKRHIQGMLSFKKGSRAKDIADEICTVYGSGTTTIGKVGNWFKKLRAGSFNLKDDGISRRSATTDMDPIKTMLAENARYRVRGVADATNIPRTTVRTHLIKMGVRTKKKEKTLGRSNGFA